MLHLKPASINVSVWLKAIQSEERTRKWSKRSTQVALDPVKFIFVWPHILFAPQGVQSARFAYQFSYLWARTRARAPTYCKQATHYSPLYYSTQPLAYCHSNLPGTAINQLQLCPHYQLMSMRTDKAWTSKTVVLIYCILDSLESKGRGLTESQMPLLSARR